MTVSLKIYSGAKCFRKGPQIIVFLEARGREVKGLYKKNA